MSADSLHPSQEELFAYRDGELKAERRALVEAHVIGCSQCRGRLNAMSAAEGDLRARPDDVDDAYFERMTESVMGRIGAGSAAPAASGAKAPPASGAEPARLERRRPEAPMEETPRRGRAGSWLGIVGGLAAAAAVVVVVVMLAERQGEWVRAPRPRVLGEPEAKREGAAGAPPAAKAPPERRAETEAAKPSAKDAASRAPETAGAANVAPPAPAAPARVLAAKGAAEAPREEGALQAASDRSEGGEDYSRLVRTYGLPSTWDESVGREALLGAEGPLRTLYITGRAGSDSARVRLYLAEAERLRLSSPTDSAGVDRVLHHYWRAIRLAADDSALAALARRRLAGFQREVGARP